MSSLFLEVAGSNPDGAHNTHVSTLLRGNWTNNLSKVAVRAT